jgi:hypothetical protein
VRVDVFGPRPIPRGWQGAGRWGSWGCSWTVVKKCRGCQPVAPARGQHQIIALAPGWSFPAADLIWADLGQDQAMAWVWLQ